MTWDGGPTDDQLVLNALVELRDEALPDAAGDPGARLRDLLDLKIDELHRGLNP